MKLVPALEYEKLRQTPEDYTRILLNKDGKFYHVYNMSAFLLKNYVCTEELQQQRGDKQMLQTKRYTTKGSDYAMLGFPVESLSKFVPECQNAHKFEDSDDLEVIIDPAQLGDDFDADLLQTAFDDWMATLPVQEPKKSKREIASGPGLKPELGRSGIFSIVAEVMAYPLEKSTAVENIEFISELKRKLSGLL